MLQQIPNPKIIKLVSINIYLCSKFITNEDTVFNFYYSYYIAWFLLFRLEILLLILLLLLLKVRILLLILIQIVILDVLLLLLLCILHLLPCIMIKRWGLLLLVLWSPLLRRKLSTHWLVLLLLHILEIVILTLYRLVIHLLLINFKWILWSWWLVMTKCGLWLRLLSFHIHI